MNLARLAIALLLMLLFTSQWMAAVELPASSVSIVLAAYPAAIDEADGGGQLPLHLAAAYGSSVEVVSWWTRDLFERRESRGGP